MWDMRWTALAVMAVLTIAVTTVVKDSEPAIAPQATPAVQAQVQGTTPSNIAILKVKGMTCGSCEATITKALNATPGVTDVAVNIPRGLVAVEYDPATSQPAKLADIVGKAGFSAEHVGRMDDMPANSGKSAKSSGCGGNCCSES